MSNKEELVLQRVAYMMRRNPETGELETWCEHIMGPKNKNPYTPFKDKESLEMAKKAGWPDDWDWPKKLKAMYDEMAKDSK